MSVSLWLTYFDLNAIAPRGIPWGLGADLPADEARLIVPSLQEFQIGESSEGARLQAAAAVWAARHDEEDLPRVMSLFIGEEQRHAAELERFLSLNGYAAISHSAGDAAFRALRHLTGGLEVSLSVLMTAEVIGYVYYGALRSATSSALLRSLSDTFVRDEAAHLLFHFEQLARMRRGRSRLGMAVTRALSRGLMAGTCCLAWMRHRRVLQRGGLTFGTFAARSFDRLSLAMRAPRHRPRPAARLPRHATHDAGVS